MIDDEEYDLAPTQQCENCGEMGHTFCADADGDMFAAIYEGNLP